MWQSTMTEGHKHSNKLTHCSSVLRLRLLRQCQLIFLTFSLHMKDVFSQPLYSTLPNLKSITFVGSVIPAHTLKNLKCEHAHTQKQ